MEPETQSWLQPYWSLAGGTQGPDHCLSMSVADAHGISRVRKIAKLTSVVPRQGSRGQTGFRGYHLICIPHLPCHCNNGDISPSLHTPSYYPGDKQEESRKLEQPIMMLKMTELNGTV